MNWSQFNFRYTLCHFGGGQLHNTIPRQFISIMCYEMDKTSIFMFEILEPGGSALGKYSI